MEKKRLRAFSTCKLLNLLIRTTGSGVGHHINIVIFIQSVQQSFRQDIIGSLPGLENKVLTLQTKIRVRVSRETPEGETVTGIVESTLGRFIFNEILPSYRK